MIENLLFIDEGCVVGNYQNLYLAGWWGEPSVPRLEKLRDHRKQFIDSSVGPLFSFSLLYQSKLRLLSKESRTLVDEITRDGEERFAADAHFVKAGGLLLSTLRFFMTGMRLINRAKKPLEVFEDQEEAVKWLSAQSQLPTEILQAAIEEFLRSCDRS
jgi:hypothetical protein